MKGPTRKYVDIIIFNEICINKEMLPKYTYVYICWRPEGSLFNTYYTAVLGRALLYSLDFSTLSLKRTL